jgi:hypothetical protein
MTTVSDCAGGRAFFKAYRDYRKEHPAFDADEPYEALPKPPTMPSHAAPMLTVPKISNPAEAPHDLGSFPQEPVVHLTFFLSQNMSTLVRQCTGTFIAKNWIATAAHCLAPAPCETSVLTNTGAPFQFFGNCDPTLGGANATSATHLYSYERVQVEWTDILGNVVPGATMDSAQETVLQIPDPHYMGGNDIDHDFALLYFDKDLFDSTLPPNSDDGSAMRIAASEFVAGTQMFVEGSVIPSSGPRVPPFEFVSVPSASVADNGAIIEAPPVGLCEGDSGGPLYRLSPLSTAQNASTVPILVGVTSSSAGPQGADGCSVPGASGATDLWRDVYADFQGQGGSFINEALQLFNGPEFSCALVPDPTASGQTIAKCWGDPCDVTAAPSPNPSNLRGCPTGYICSRPGTDVAANIPLGIDGCPTCGSLPNDCSCVVGQCLPDPGP